MFAIINAEKYEEYSQWRWTAKYYAKQNRFYATRHVAREYPGRVVYMHRQVLGLEYGDPRNGDHIEPMATLDNTIQNLRIASGSQNMMNQRRRVDNTSGYKGVTFAKRNHKWLAQICVYGEHHFLGYFITKEDAADAYRLAALKYHGDFARFD